MQINNRSFARSLAASVCGLLTATGAVAGQTAEKAQGLAPVGISGDVIGTGVLTQSAAGLLVVLVSVVALAWMMKRFGRLQSSAKGALRMIDGMALSTRERVVLVQVGDTQVLLGVAPGRVEALHVLEQPVVTEGDVEMTGNFATRLKEALVKEQQ